MKRVESVFLKVMNDVEKLKGMGISLNLSLTQVDADIRKKVIKIQASFYPWWERQRILT